MVEATVSAGNTSQTPIDLEPQLEDPRRVATSTVVPTVVSAASEVVAAVVVAVAAAAEVHLTAPAEELVWR
jgi:hypothetical protein